MYAPEAIRQICERLAQEQDDARGDELIARLRMVVEEDREGLSDGFQFLAGRCFATVRMSGDIGWSAASARHERDAHG